MAARKDDVGDVVYDVGGFYGCIFYHPLCPMFPGSFLVLLEGVEGEMAKGAIEVDERVG